MSVVKNSAFCRLVLALISSLAQWYDGSLLAAGLRRFGRGCRVAWANSAVGRGWRNSAVVGFFTREGALSRSWPHSLLCRGLTTLISLPTILLQVIYGKARPAFEDSVLAQLFLAVVEQTPLLAGWVMLGIMVTPYEAWNNFYSLAGFSVCLFLSFFAGTRRPGARFALADIGPWLMAFAGAVVLAWYLSPDREESTRHLLFHVTCMFCVLVLVTTVEKREQLVRLLGVISAALAVMSVMGFYQRATGIEVNPLYVDMSLDLNRGMPGRVFAFYENPNAFGEVLLLLLPLSFALILCARTWWAKTLALFSTVLGCGAIAMTYSRAAWIGLVVAILLFLLLWNKKIVPIVIVIALAGTLLLPDTVSNRILTIFSSSDTSTNSRFPYYEAAWRFIRDDHMLLGGGLGSDVIRDLIKEGKAYFTGEDEFIHCHNIYLQIWCETGLVGLLTFVGGILWTIRQGIRAVGGALCSPQTRLAVIGGVSALLGAMICGLADYLWNYPRVMLIFWFVVGVALAGIRLAAREKQETP